MSEIPHGNCRNCQVTLARVVAYWNKEFHLCWECMRKIDEAMDDVRASRHLPPATKPYRPNCTSNQCEGRSRCICGGDGRMVGGG